MSPNTIEILEKRDEMELTSVYPNRHCHQHNYCHEITYPHGIILLQGKPVTGHSNILNILNCQLFAPDVFISSVIVLYTSIIEIRCIYSSFSWLP